MGKDMRHVLLLTAMLFISTPALSAQPNTGNYWGISFLELQQTASGTPYTPTGIMLRYGTPLSQEWSFEIHTGAGNSGGTTSINRISSIFVRYGDYYEQMYLYTMFGVSRLNATVGGTKYSDDRGSYGVGIQLKIGTASVNMEYMNYGTTNNYSLNSLNFGLIKPL
jgi:hypothetical protein